MALLLKFVIHTGVISAERTNTNDSNADCTLVSQVNDFLRPARSAQSYDQQKHLTADER
jgi:hypothetical protein